MIAGKNWIFEEIAAGSLKLQEELNISSITAGLLYKRGIDNKAKAQKFLYGSLQELTDPWLLKGMQQAVDRIVKAIAQREKIIIYGDYDVDGVCSIVILKECIEGLGGIVDYYVPDRFDEGYGINMPAIESLVRQQYKLLISVDCGITSAEEASYAAAAGMEVIITDHHTPGAILPPAVAVVNPKIGGNEDNQYLCGAGIAYYLVLALQQKLPGNLNNDKWLELAALATVADIVPLLGDNHILVRYGLQLLSRTERIGLKALLKISGLENKNLTAGQVGFVIAPRLNAAGRLDSARKSVELLLACEEKVAHGLAVYMNMINDERRQIEENIFEQALDQIIANKRDEDNVIVAAGDNWHKGVIGIVASRLCEKFYRPSIVISWEGNTGKGSGRSIKGFNLYTALDCCKEYLKQFGGHQMAAGITIERRQYDAFAAALNDYSQIKMTENLLSKTCRTDGEIDLQEINYNLIEELKALEPFGEGNPQPVFIMRNMPINSLRAVGSTKEHISFDFSRSDLQGIAFRKPEYMDFPYRECWHDVIGEISENDYRGKKSLQIRVKEMKMSFVPDNLNSFAGMDNIPYRQLMQMITEIRAGRPVIVLFPTVRCLLKYRPGLENCIRSSFLHNLHGQMRADELADESSFLLRGRAGVYLTTTAYFTYLTAGNCLPEALKYILPVGAEEPVAGRTSPDYIYERILFSFNAEQIVKSVHKKLDLNNLKRNLIYSNRNTTVTEITAQIPAVICEAALADRSKRRALRRQFEQLAAGSFITDGNYNIGDEFNNIDDVILADLPFSMCETMFILDQVKTGDELKLTLAAGEKQLEQNSAYLQQRYPEESEVYKILNWLQGINGGVIRQELNNLVHLIQEKHGAGISRLKLLSILQILTDSGLCRISKQGSIMEIRYHSGVKSGLDLDKSAAYREGINERKAWRDFASNLNI
ncbi:MAG: single-stranded-DNA-specific exonuclease RecJ [Syntrophomonadaceae bacterium]|nr:single-stranded-DNA-specific exonuclease RecJ [Syntrophomonadaceae bacterium]